MMMNIVQASQWRQQTWRPLTPLTLPVGEFYVHHGASGAATLATLRAYERYHVQTLGWAALGYNFAVTADGTIYEGRGWDRVGAHTQGRNSSSVAMVLVGDWSSGTVPQPMVDSCAQIISAGRRIGALTPDSTLRGHRQAPGASTTCPGQAGMAAMPRIVARITDGPSEEDEMTDEDRALLRQAATDARYARERATVAVGALGRIEKQLEGRKVGDDLRRIRLSLRAIGRRAGLVVDPDGDPDQDIVA